ncbi:MAG: hypothetical protein HQ559_11645 [Lentisphaerae bacterium]|nr:hypothetical protein [Lentisphaerota bacterium]
MKCSYDFAVHTEEVTCELAPGRSIKVPVIPGILKHPRADQLSALLVKPRVVEKYTAEALRKASWPILRQFSRAWLRECLDRANIKPARRRALMFLLS